MIPSIISSSWWRMKRGCDAYREGRVLTVPGLVLGIRGGKQCLPGSLCPGTRHVEV